MFKSRAICALSHPWSSNSMICRSRGPTCVNCSSMITCTSPNGAPRSLQVARKPGPSAHLSSVFASHFANSWPKQGVFRLIPRKFFQFAFSGGKPSVWRSFQTGWRPDYRLFHRPSRVKHLEQTSDIEPSKVHIYTDPQFLIHCAIPL
jgi:hypothetical protein